MKSSNKNEHQDVIRIIATSDKSFDDAVCEGIKELKADDGKHSDLEFTSYEVVQLQGTISDDGKSCKAEFYQVVMDVAGTHKH